MFGLFKRDKKNTDIETLRKKAQDNDVNAQYALSLAYFRGEGVVKNLQKSSYWFKQAYEGSKTKDN